MAKGAQGLDGAPGRPTRDPQGVGERWGQEAPWIDLCAPLWAQRERGSGGLAKGAVISSLLSFEKKSSVVIMKILVTNIY